MKRLILSCAIVIALSSVLCCQVTTGVPPFSSTTGGPDVANLGSLNVHFSMPVFHKPGRGMPFTFDLSYDTSVWYPVGSSGNQSWQPVGTWGWTAQTQAAIGYISYNASTGGPVPCNPPNDISPRYFTVYSGFVYHDIFGNSHAFSASVSTMDQSCSTASSLPPPSASSLASDGSGFTLNARSDPGATIVTPDGATITPPLGSPSGSGTTTDRNGNQITVDGSGHVTDTLGATALTISGGAPTPLTMAYTDSNGNPESVTISYTPKAVQTYFGCSGVAEYGPTTVNLVDHISYPDGTQYKFVYENTAAGPNVVAGAVTGRIASIQLPTGGTIAYSYINGGLTSPAVGSPVSGYPAPNPIVCADGSAAGLTRQTMDGVTTYSRSGSGSAWTTNITDPMNSETVINFQSAALGGASTTNFYETQRQIYQGLASANNWLLNVMTCYNGSWTNCNSTAITSAISNRVITTQLPNGKASTTNTLYNTFGLVTEHDEYDFNNLVRYTLITYASFPGTNIVDRPATIQLKDAARNIQGETAFDYDLSALAQTSAVAQHDYTNFPYTYTVRGNVTRSKNCLAATPMTSASWCISGGSGTWVSTQYSYDDLGNVQSSTDPGGHSTSFSYASVFADAYLTRVDYPSTSSPVAATHTNWFNYDANTGLRIGFTDENNQVTTFSYDNMLQPSSILYPGNGVTNFYRTNPTTLVRKDQIDGTPTWRELWIGLDKMGREIRRVSTNGEPAGTDWNEQDTCYNGRGLTSFKSYPYQGNGSLAAAQICSGAGDSFSYDALDRPLSVTHSDGKAVSYSYAGAAVSVTDEGNGTSGVQHISQVDGLGRLASVCEVTGASQLGTGGTPTACGLDYSPSSTGFLTTYSYDVHDNLLSITQGSEGRGYSYDSLSRLTSETHPESGTTSYNYNNDDLLFTRVRPSANQTNSAVTTTTTYSWDERHRLRGYSYSDGTPPVTFDYDPVTPLGGLSSISLANTGGRMSAEYVTVSGQIQSGAVFSYDGVGRIVNNSQCTPINCASGNHPFSYSYNLAGDMTQRTLYYGVVLQPTINLAGLPSQMAESFSDANHPGTLISAAHYNAFGELVSANLGNGIAQSRTYNTRGWLQSLTDGTLYNVNTPSTPISYTPNGNLLGTNDKINGSWSYVYDDFNRLKTANGSAAGNYSYDYDRFGNRWHQNGSAGWSQSFDTNNHIQGAPWSYDAAGNMINDTFHNYTYDAENRLIRVDGGTTATYIYDAEGRRVRSTRNGTTVDYMYGLGGEVAEMNSGGSLNRAEIYFAGAHLATFTNPMMYFNHSDWLGTERVRSSASGTQAETCTNLPFGDGASCTGSDTSPLHYTGEEHDAESNLEHTQFRQLSTTQGRWLSPDPYMGSMDLTNPQSLNRYSYVANNPLNATDPKGLDQVKLLDPSTCDGIACGGNGVLGGGFGGGGGAFGAPYTPGLPGAVILGNDIFDAISGSPGTYLSQDMYGNLSFGFSPESWRQTHSVLDYLATPVTKVVTDDSGRQLGRDTSKMLLRADGGWLDFFQSTGNEQLETSVWTALAKARDDYFSYIHIHGLSSEPGSGGTGWQILEREAGQVLWPLVVDIPHSFTPFPTPTAPSFPQFPPPPLPLPPTPK